MYRDTKKGISNIRILKDQNSRKCLITLQLVMCSGYEYYQSALLPMYIHVNILNIRESSSTIMSILSRDNQQRLLVAGVENVTTSCVSVSATRVKYVEGCTVSSGSLAL